MELQDNFDFSEDPKRDFNLFVNGKWLKNNPIPAKYTRWGTFEVLYEENLQKIKNLIESSKDDFENLNILYSAAMNEKKIKF